MVFARGPTGHSSTSKQNRQRQKWRHPGDHRKNSWVVTCGDKDVLYVRKSDSRKTERGFHAPSHKQKGKIYTELSRGSNRHVIPGSPGSPSFAKTYTFVWIRSHVPGSYFKASAHVALATFKGHPIRPDLALSALSPVVQLMTAIEFQTYLRLYTTMMVKLCRRPYPEASDPLRRGADSTLCRILFATSAGKNECGMTVRKVTSCTLGISTAF